MKKTTRRSKTKRGKNFKERKREKSAPVSREGATVLRIVGSGRVKRNPGLPVTQGMKEADVAAAQGRKNRPVPSGVGKEREEGARATSLRYWGRGKGACGVGF